MPLDIPIGFAHVVHSLRLVGDNEPMAVTFGVELSPDVPLAPNSVANDLHNAFGQSWQATLGNPYKLVQTEIRFPSGDQGGFGLGIFVGDFAMANAGSFLPQNCAYLIHKRSGLGGRRHRGRCYMPGVNDVLIDDKGLLNGTALTGVGNASEAWRIAIEAVGGVDRMVILHTIPVGGVVTAPTPVTVLNVDPVIATQRRRLR